MSLRRTALRRRDRHEPRAHGDRRAGGPVLDDRDVPDRRGASAIVIVAAAALLGAMAVVGVRMAGWRSPRAEEDFERVVLRAERLAREGTAAEPTEDEFLELDPYDDDDFEELVRDAMDDLPDLLRAALDRNVAVVISDERPPPRRLRPLQRRRRHPRRLPRPDHHLPRHPAPRLRPRRRPAAPPGHRHGPPRAGAPHRVRRAGRAGPRPVSAQRAASRCDAETLRVRTSHPGRTCGHRRSASPDSVESLLT